MWTLIFSTATNRGVAADRDAGEGEYSRLVECEVCAFFRETPSRYEWTGTALVEVAPTILAAEKLAKDQLQMWELIKEEREFRKEGGFQVGDLWFHSDLKSKLEHIGLTLAAMQAMQAGGTLETVLSPTPWKTMSGEKTPLTVGLVFQIFQAGLLMLGSVFHIAEEHKSAMEASPDPLSYDFKTGWPENYLGI